MFKPKQNEEEVDFVMNIRNVMRMLNNTGGISSSLHSIRDVKLVLKFTSFKVGPQPCSRGEHQ